TIFDIDPWAHDKWKSFGLLLLNFMRRLYASRRLRTSHVIGDDSTVSHVDGQSIAFGAALLRIFNPRWIALQHRNLVHACILHPITGALSVWLRQDNVSLRNCFVYLAGLLLQIHISHFAGKTIGPLPDVDVTMVMQRASDIGISHRIAGSKYR